MRFGINTLAILGLVLAGCTHTKVLPLGQADAGIKRELEEFTRRFIEDFNSGNPAAFERNFHMPHTRTISPEIEWIDDPDRPLIDYAKLRATGWDHSVLNELEVIYATPVKGIVRIHFSRITKDGDVLLSTDSFYIITKIKSKWGISTLFIGANELTID